MKDYNYFLQQIEKAAKILDLKSDYPKAISVLNEIIHDSDIDKCRYLKFDALVFLANIYYYLEDLKNAKEYITEAEKLKLNDEEKELANIEGLKEIKNNIKS